MHMNEPSEIVRLAARGDGVTADGQHAGFAVPGDKVLADGSIVHGPNHAEPPCVHFTKCGGCQLQHADEAILRDFVRSRVLNAAEGQGLEAADVFETHLSPAKSRRRATVHAMRAKGGAIVGFREAGAHRIIDLKQCAVVRPEIFAIIEPLRAFLAKHGPKNSVDAALTWCDQGLDVGLTNFPLDGLGPTEGALEFAKQYGLARLSIDQGYGAETVWEPEPATVTLSGVAVSLPTGAFLQATQDAETTMIGDAVEWLGDARLVADLFSGLGTFAFALAAAGVNGRKALAVEADRAAFLACKSASARTQGAVLTLHRDLFRNPLQPSELNRFDAVLLDPPRAGAKAQIAEIAASTLSRVAYISCNPSSWARDAATLAESGFKLSRLRPVGQFRWSTHVELVSLFER